MNDFFLDKNLRYNESIAYPIIKIQEKAIENNEVEKRIELIIRWNSHFHSSASLSRHYYGVGLVCKTFCYPFNQ